MPRGAEGAKRGEQAEAVRADFAITSENAPAVAEICHRLDGLPLAIELAAARVRLLPPPAMLARLEQRLPLMIGGHRDQPTRQQTLRGAIAWSDDLLGPDERKLFRRLAVFVGGCTLEAAEAVAGGPGSGEGALDVLEGLGALVDNSLVRQEEAGEPRFLMLETIREYGQEQLDASGEADEARERHAAFFLALAEEAEPGLYGPDEAAWLVRLEAEHDNLRAALGWLLKRDPATGLRLAAALARFWYLRGHLGDEDAWLERALTAAPPAPSVARARALNGAAALAASRGDVERDVALNRASLAMARGLGDGLGEARALGDLGVSAIDLGEVAAAMPLLEEAVALARRLGEPWIVAICLNNLGWAVFHQGRLAEAAPLLEEALGLARQLGYIGSTAAVLGSLGEVAAARGETAAGAAFYGEGLALFQRIGYREHVARHLGYLATLAVGHPNPVGAVRLLGAAAALCEAVGICPPPSEQSPLEAAAAAGRAALGEAAFAAAWGAGRALSEEAAVAEALALADDLHRGRRPAAPWPAAHRPCAPVPCGTRAGGNRGAFGDGGG